MPQYTYPYAPQQPVIYTSSSHSHHGHDGHTYGTPLRRANSAGHAYTSTPAYAHGNVAPSPGVQYLNVPGTDHHNRSHSRHRHTSHGQHEHEHGHGHRYSASASHLPITYTVPAPAYHHPNSGHQRSHSVLHRHPSHSRAHSQSRYADPRAYGGDHHGGQTASLGDRIRSFFGMQPSSHSHHNYGDLGRSRHHSFSGHRNYTTRTGPLIFGSTNPRGYVDEYGREVDDRGRQIHRY